MRQKLLGIFILRTNRARISPWIARLVLAIGCSASALSIGAYADETQNIRERLNKIFYWQIADELQLDTKVEKQMVAVIEDIQKRREAALKDRDAALEDIRKLADNKESKFTAASVEPPLNRYQKALATLAGLDNEEYKRLKSLMGVESVARFYLVRENVTKKIREALKNAEISQTHK